MAAAGRVAVMSRYVWSRIVPPPVMALVAAAVLSDSVASCWKSAPLPGPLGLELFPISIAAVVQAPPLNEYCTRIRSVGYAELAPSPEKVPPRGAAMATVMTKFR